MVRMYILYACEVVHRWQGGHLMMYSSYEILFKILAQESFMDSLDREKPSCAAASGFINCPKGACSNQLAKDVMAGDLTFEPAHGPGPWHSLASSITW